MWRNIGKNSGRREGLDPEQGQSLPPRRIQSVQKSGTFHVNRITFDEGRPLDLILPGRITIDLNPAHTDQVREDFKPLKNVHMFEKFVGGSPADIAASVTRYGLKPGFLGLQRSVRRLRGE